MSTHVIVFQLPSQKINAHVQDRRSYYFCTDCVNVSESTTAELAASVAHVPRIPRIDVLRIDVLRIDVPHRQ